MWVIIWPIRSIFYAFRTVLFFMLSIWNLIYSTGRGKCTLDDSVQVLEEVGKGEVAEEPISNFGFEELTADLNYFWHDYAISVAFAHDVGSFFEVVEPTFFSLFLTEVVKDKLEILARSPEHNLIFPTVELIVMNFHQTIVDKNISVDDIEHAPQFNILVVRVDQSDWVEMIDAAVFLYDETTLDQLADAFIDLGRIVDIF